MVDMEMLRGRGFRKLLHCVPQKGGSSLIAVKMGAAKTILVELTCVNEIASHRL